MKVPDGTVTAGLLTDETRILTWSNDRTARVWTIR